MKETVRDCPVEVTLQAIGGRWKVFVLHQLFRRTLRFSELQRQINSSSTGSRTSTVTPKMLTQELRQMEASGLVRREVYPQVPPKVEYSLTPLGRTLRPVVDAMVVWGEQQKKPSAQPVQTRNDTLEMQLWPTAPTGRRMRARVADGKKPGRTLSACPYGALRCRRNCKLFVRGLALPEK